MGRMVERILASKATYSAKKYGALLLSVSETEKQQRGYPNHHRS